MPKSKKKNATQTSNKTAGANKRITGQGDYYTDRVAPVGKKLVPDGSFARGGDKLGSFLADRFIGSDAKGLGGRLGKSLGSWLSRIVGFGDYTVMSNSLINKGGAIPPGETVPDFGTHGNATRIRHREFISDILVPTSPTAFNNFFFVINPGNPQLFPLLANIANNYSEYQINGMVFEFKSMTSPISTGGPLGTVVMACNYDVLENAYVDKIHMENSQYACSAPPSQSQIHTIECAPFETTNKIKFVRTPMSSVSASQDARFMDHGLFQIATVGLPGSAGQVLGELWVSYDITLYKPEITETIGYEGQKITGVAPLSPATIFGGSPLYAGQPYATAASSTVTFVTVGTYMVSMRLQGTGVGAVMSGTAARTRLGAIISATATDSLWCDLLNVVAIGQTYIINATSSTTITSCVLEIAPYAYTLGV